MLFAQLVETSITNIRLFNDDCGSTRGAAVRVTSDDDDSHVDDRVRQTN